MVMTRGTRLGAYEIVAPLGTGGMGEVYRAKDPRLGREVALKVLPEAFARDADRLARFEREARTVAGLNHPNIVVLYSVEEEHGVRFLTMELVEGQSLAQLVSPGGLPVARVLDLGIALAEALAAAHERGVVHRDLKPANVMVTREGRLKVLDFGLAKLEVSEPGLGATQAATMATPLSTPGQVVGTVPYMAPEQIRGDAVDARTDLFALGVMLYELASGRRPFIGASSADVSSSILRDTPEPLASVRADLPADLDRIVRRCLEKAPRVRFQTALDLCSELRRLKQAGESGAPAPQAVGGAIHSLAVLPLDNRRRHDRGADLGARAPQGAPRDLAHLGDEVQGRRPRPARDRARAERGRDPRGLRAADWQARARLGAARLGENGRDAVGRPLRWRDRGRARSAEPDRGNGGEGDRGAGDATRGDAPREAAPREPRGARRVPEGPAHRHCVLPASHRSEPAALPARARARPDVRPRVGRDRPRPHGARRPRHGAGGRGRRAGSVGGHAGDRAGRFPRRGSRRSGRGRGEGQGCEGSDPQPAARDRAESRTDPGLHRPRAPLLLLRASPRGAGDHVEGGQPRPVVDDHPHVRRRRALLRPRIRALPALLPQGGRARPPLRWRAHGPGTLARSARPVRGGPPGVRRGPEAERRRRRAVVRPRPSRGQQRKRRCREKHLEGADRGTRPPRGLVVGHRRAPRLPPRRGRSLPLARRRGRGRRKRTHPAARPPAPRSDPPGPALPGLAAQGGARVKPEESRLPGHARDHARVTKAEALHLLRKNSREAAEAVRGFTDEQLDQVAPFSLSYGAPVTAQFVVEDHAVRHSWHHLARIRKAVGR